MRLKDNWAHDDQLENEPGLGYWMRLGTTSKERLQWGCGPGLHGIIRLNHQEMQSRNIPSTSCTHLRVRLFGQQKGRVVVRVLRFRVLFSAKLPRPARAGRDVHGGPRKRKHGEAKLERAATKPSAQIISLMSSQMDRVCEKNA